MNLEKYFGKIGAAIGSLLFLCVGFGLLAFALIGTHTTGFDTKLGDTLGTGVQLTIQQGGPAITNILGPSGKQIQQGLANVGPTGTSEWGFITVNWDQLRGKGASSSSSSSGNSGGGSGSNGSGNGEGGQQQPTGCTKASTPESQAALQYWNMGEWNNAITKFQQTDVTSDCLAASMETTFKAFNDELARLPQITDAAEFESTLQDLLSMNPKVRVLYSAQAMYKAQLWSQTAPLDFAQAGDVFKGATISVVSVHHGTYAGEKLNMNVDIDKASLKFDWGNKWQFTLQDVSKDNAVKLATAFGLPDTNTFLTEGKVITAPGQFVPSDTPTPKDPRQNYTPPSGASAPLPTAPVPSLAQQSGSNCTNVAKFVGETIPDNTQETAGATFTKTWTLQNAGTCTWTSSYSLVFDSGTQMNGASVDLTQDVTPGSSVTVSTNLVAPSTAGSYTGNWKLRAGDGTVFGLAGNLAFWVKIVVR